MGEGCRKNKAGTTAECGSKTCASQAMSMHVCCNDCCIPSACVLHARAAACHCCCNLMQLLIVWGTVGTLKPRRATLLSGQRIAAAHLQRIAGKRAGLSMRALLLRSIDTVEDTGTSASRRHITVCSTTHAAELPAHNHAAVECTSSRVSLTLLVKSHITAW
jgi:hypothetical protein